MSGNEKKDLSNTRVIVTSMGPEESGGLPQFIYSSLGREYEVDHVYPPTPRLNPFLLLRTFRLRIDEWKQNYEKYGEHTLSAWDKFSNAVVNDGRVKRSTHIIQVGLNFNSFPEDHKGFKSVYLHATLQMALNSHYHCHNWIPPLSQIAPWLKRERDILSRCDKVLIGSGFLRSHLVEEYGVSDDEKIVFVGTGVPPFPESEATGKVVKYDKPTLLFVGKHFERKGGEVLLRAFRRVREVVPDLQLYIVGPRNLRRGLPEGVKLLGRITDRGRLQDILRRSHVFVLPTLHDSFGFAFIEAMHFGIPCIGTDIFAIPERIENGKTGIIVRPGDEHALAHAIEDLVNDDSKARMLGEAGRKKVKDYSWDEVGARIRQELGLLSGSCQVDSSPECEVRPGGERSEKRTEGLASRRGNGRCDGD